MAGLSNTNYRKHTSLYTTGGKKDTKEFVAKVAREGRKFGLRLVIVSHHPRGIDVNILSQMGSSQL
jgi:uncharacterized protein